MAIALAATFFVLASDGVVSFPGTVAQLGTLVVLVVAAANLQIDVAAAGRRSLGPGYSDRRSWWRPVV